MLSNTASFGLFFLLCKLSVDLELFFKTTDCGLAEADCVVLEDQYKNKNIVHVIKKKVYKTLGLQRYIKDNYCNIINTPYGRFIYDFKQDR